jgi:hypothetical protein
LAEEHALVWFVGIVSVHFDVLWNDLSAEVPRYINEATHPSKVIVINVSLIKRPLDLFLSIRR